MLNDDIKIEIHNYKKMKLTIIEIKNDYGLDIARI